MKETHELTVLLVEDNSSDLLIIKSFLTDFGFRKIHDASDGSQAFFKLENMQFDLILTDWKMPNISGLSFLQKIKFDERYKDIPIIFLTGVSDKDEVVIALKEGATDYLVKPIGKLALEAKIKKIFPGVALNSERKVPKE